MQLDNQYLFLTCVKNNQINLIEDFINDEPWYFSHINSLHPAAIYMCIILGHTLLLEKLLDLYPLFKVELYLDAMHEALNEGICSKHYATAKFFLDYLMSDHHEDPLDMVEECWN